MKISPAAFTLRWTAWFAACLGMVAVGHGEPSDAKEGDRAQSPIVMEKFKVDSTYMPKLSFGLSLDVWKDNNTQKIISLVVAQVRPGSDAEEKGLVSRTRIERIDGRPVQDFAASFLPGTELNQIFVNRRDGAKIVLEITIPGEPGEQQVTLVEHRTPGMMLPSVLERVGNP